MDSRKDPSSLNTALVAFGIVFREALEAVLILVILLSILRKLEAPGTARWIHLGWISALASGLLLYLAIHEVLMSNMGIAEKIEGYVGLIAVGLLLYVGLWFHARTHINQWKKFLLDQMNGHISRGNMLGLAAISFMAVFREVVETILFVKVLELDGHNFVSILQGTIAAALATAIAGFFMYKYSAKFNISQMIRTSTYLILGFALVILGKSIHALQVSGTIPTNYLRSFSIPPLGLYGTAEGIGAQLLLTFILFADLRRKASANQ